MTDYEEKAERLVRNEVRVCLSHLVSTLARGYAAPLSGHYRGKGDDSAALAELIEQAFELSTPVLDSEEAARQAGWRTADLTPGMLVNDSLGEDAESWQEACATSGIDPYEWEVYEHWAVGASLARDLIAVGEKVDMDFAGVCVWACTTTGQAISMDPCIRKVLELREKRWREGYGG